MEAAFRIKVEGLRFRAPIISHSIAVMVLAVAFHSEETNGVGGSVKIFLLPDLSPAVGSEAVLLTKRRNAVFDGVTTIYFDDTSLLLGRHKVTPLKSWDK